MRFVLLVFAVLLDRLVFGDYTEHDLVPSPFSQGSWQQCSYHLITSICASAFLSLPFAMSLIGWTGGSIMLVAGAIISWYGYLLLSDVLEACELNVSKGDGGKVERHPSIACWLVQHVRKSVGIFVHADTK